MMSRLFEKRPQQLWLGISMADGMAGPGLAILGTRRRKLRALQKKVQYLTLYKVPHARGAPKIRALDIGIPDTSDH